VIVGSGIALAAAVGGGACGGTTVVDPGAGGATSTTTTSSSGVGGTTTSSSSGTTGGGFGTCDGPGQCTLTFEGCCGPCGVPEADQLVPVALDQLDAFRDQSCMPGDPCPDCLSCTNGELFAYCESGSCAGAHLDDFNLRACDDNDDCRLRFGSECYEPCGGIPECDGLTAINIAAGSTLADLVCDPDAPPPPPCVPTYPDDVVATCNAGTCVVAPAP
jgi:hypothetical protein